MTTIIGGDVGKYRTRLVSGFNKHVHSSRIIRHDDSKILHDLKDGKDFLVDFNKQKYFVGDLAKREGKFHIQYRNTSKVHYTTLINLICGLDNFKDDNFKIVLNTPIGNKDKSEIKALKKLIKGEHRIPINGEGKKINIEEVGIWVEGAAGFFAQPRGGIVQGFDFGSTTTNVFFFEDRYFINERV
ncbi:hypothetical protein RZN22_09640 [Bacillaceae bacterium S4-13-58]